MKPTSAFCNERRLFNYPAGADCTRAQRTLYTSSVHHAARAVIKGARRFPEQLGGRAIKVNDIRTIAAFSGLTLQIGSGDALDIGRNA